MPTRYSLFSYCVAPIRKAVASAGMLAGLTRRLKDDIRFAASARHDNLTGLQSRALCEARLFDLDMRQLRCLLIIDVKRFHEINSCFGHDLANQCLVEVAQRLTGLLKGADVLSRVQTDVFVAISQRLQKRDEGTTLVRKVRQVLTAPYCSDKSITLDFAIGAVFVGDGAADQREIMRQADIALHHAKQRPQTHVTFYKKSLSDAMLRKHRIDQRLRVAVAQEHIVPYLQPIVDLGNSVVLGFEILARWHDAELGRITPDEFIPVAETNGLVGRIGEQLLEKACTAAMAWERPMHLSVNLSASQLSDPLCALRLMSVLGRTGFPAPRLHIEITETTKLEQSIAAKENLYALRKAGARIMLDDFGAGYCSFERLASHQIDGVKIDKSLTSDMTTRESTHTIVLSIIYLARNLGLDVVAEGVETTEQSSALLRAGCNMAQGYHYGRPMPLANVPAFLGGDVFAATGSDDSVTALAG